MPSPLIDLSHAPKTLVNPGIGLFTDDAGRIQCGPWEHNLEDDRWVAPSVFPPALYASLGTDPLARMTLARRNLLSDRLGLARGVFPADSLSHIIGFYVLGTLADPRGITAPKPVRFGYGGMDLYLGSFGRVEHVALTTNHPNFDATLAVRRADYRRERQRGIVPLEALQRWTGSDGRKLFGREPTADDLDLLLDSRDRGDGSRPPASNIGDTAARADNTDLNAADTGKTFNGAADTWQWTETLRDTRIASNKFQPVDNGKCLCRAEKDLSSDDHYSEVNGITLVDVATNSRFLGAVARFNPSANDGYPFLYTRNTNPYFHELAEMTAGSDTTLSTTTEAITLPAVFRVECDGSTIRGLIDEVEKHSATDVTHTGYLRVGIGGRARLAAGESEFDAFYGADLAVASAPRSSIAIRMIAAGLV